MWRLGGTYLQDPECVLGLTYDMCNAVHWTDLLSPPSSAGGVNLMIPSGKIKVRNTLESRLELLSAQVRLLKLPAS